MRSDGTRLKDIDPPQTYRGAAALAASRYTLLYAVLAPILMLLQDTLQLILYFYSNL
jgi:hypothetical protein